MSKEYFKAGFWMMIGMAVAGTLVNYVGDWARKEVAKTEDQKEKPEEKSKADEWEKTIK